MTRSREPSLEFLPEDEMDMLRPAPVPEMKPVIRPPRRTVSRRMSAPGTIDEMAKLSKLASRPSPPERRPSNASKVKRRFSFSRRGSIGKDSNQNETETLRQQVVHLQAAVRERDRELTSLRLESFELSMGPSGNWGADLGDKEVVGADELQELKRAKETALFQAAELACRLAECQAHVDMLQTKLRRSNAETDKYRQKCEELELRYGKNRGAAPFFGRKKKTSEDSIATVDTSSSSVDEAYLSPLSPSKRVVSLGSTPGFA